jgi:diphosphomevalonate decarboxylase
LKEKDFDLLSKVVMKDSNNTHAVMLDTTPPILYLNDISRNIIGAINQINKDKGKNVCAYTFESGPNPHIITTEQYKEEVIDRLIKVEGMQSLISAKLGNGPILLGDSESLINKDNLQPIKH